MPQFFSVFFVLGLIVMLTFAWQRFNEPSFPNEPTLPRRVVPLRYLFLGSAYHRARYLYVAALLALYCIFVWPGPKFAPALSVAIGKDFPSEAWALLVALLLAGFVPNVKWVSAVEEFLRRQVHSWFLVPDGVLTTIGVLEDTSYEPPAVQFEALDPALKKRLRQDLNLRPNALRYRWARATMLLASLQQMGAGAQHPLKKAAFDPFQDDFNEIRTSYKALESEVETATQADEDKLLQPVDDLLRRIYAYISWGVRNQASSEKEVDELLNNLGFRIPLTGGRPLFNVVAPALLAVAGIAFVFWVAAFLVLNALQIVSLKYTDIVINALTSGIAATVMYGGAVVVALKQRERQIERKVWREGSPNCFVSIAVWAGVITWVTIFVTTALGQPDAFWQSLFGLVQLLKSLAGAHQASVSENWVDLPIMIATALPWFIAGGTVSVIVANIIGRNLVREKRTQRIRDAACLAIGLGIAVLLSALIQDSLIDHWLQRPINWPFIPIIGLAGAACGAVIGFLVPQACRDNIVAPSGRIMTHALQDLMNRARATLGDEAKATEWVLTPRMELDGITPAEAVQYKGLATSVLRLLADVNVSARNDSPVGDNAGRPAPVVITGGRGN